MMAPTLAALAGALLAVPWTAAAQDIPILGPRVGLDLQTGQVPMRRDINNLYDESGPQWDLYIGALTAMQDANETDVTSYFQIAGIHGQPYVAWSGGGPQSGAEAGYCPHNQMLFGTWHRGYLSLYEQILVGHARDIAAAYPGDDERIYVDMAEILRLPYWDWAMDSNVPPVTALPTVFVHKPVNGTVQRTSVRNPLYRYTYPESAQGGEFGNFDGKDHTKRCVDAGQSYPESANSVLAGFNLKEKVYNVFIKATSFDEMVSAQSAGPNFEGPHGEVHVGAACGQDLVYLSTSAFEPLFWLHHANVDRLIAYWQALHYENATMHFSYPSDELFATPRGTISTPESPMWPFIGHNDQPLTSESVTHIGDWGYTYAPIQAWMESPGETKMAVSRAVNRLYGPKEQLEALKNLKRRRRAATSTPRTEYFAKIEVERAELELPCQVQLFLNDHLAGSFTLLDMPRRGKSYGEIPLKKVLEAAGKRGSTRQAVADCIESGLEVVIKKLDGKTIKIDDVPSLKVEVEDVDIIPPLSLNELPKLGKSRTRPATTRAKQVARWIGPRHSSASI